MSLTFENVAISTKKKINQTFWFSDSCSGFFDDLFFLGIGIGTSLITPCQFQLLVFSTNKGILTTMLTQAEAIVLVMITNDVVIMISSFEVIATLVAGIN